MPKLAEKFNVTEIVIWVISNVVKVISGVVWVISNVLKVISGKKHMKELMDDIHMMARKFKVTEIVWWMISCVPKLISVVAWMISNVKKCLKAKTS